MFLNIHTHNFEINKNSKSSVVCLLDTKQFNIIKNYPGQFFSIGFHPKDITEHIDFSLFENTLKLKNVIAIGEIGLDRYVQDIEQQTVIFEKLIKLSEKHNKPVILHCVKSYSEILHFRKTFNKTPWIIHGFRGKWQLCSQLIENNILTSFGTYILKPTANLLEVIEKIPLEYIFFETDESSIPIEDLYNKFVEVRQLSQEGICKKIEVNFNRIFIQNKS